MELNKSIAKYKRTRLAQNHKCQWCGDKYEYEECEYEKDFGWLCKQCVDYLMTQGETLVIIK